MIDVHCSHSQHNSAATVMSCQQHHCQSRAAESCGMGPKLLTGEIIAVKLLPLGLANGINFSEICSNSTLSVSTLKYSSGGTNIYHDIEHIE